MSEKLRRKRLKRPLKDLRNVENALFRDLLAQVLLSSEVKKICFARGIADFGRGVRPSESLEYLGSRLMDSDASLLCLANLLAHMQPTDIFNFLVLDHRKVDFVAGYLALQLRKEIFKLRKSPFKFAFFKLKVASQGC